MNLLLSDDYLLQDYPESITNTIRSGHATVLRFNRKGDYLASGRVDGAIAIWDLETMGVARKLRGHRWKAVLWDLQHGKRLREVRFRAPAYMAELHPWNHLQFVASLFEEQPVLVDMTDLVDVKHIIPSVPKRINSEGSAAQKEKQAKEDAKEKTTSAIWTSTGDHIIAGTSKGKINLIDAKTLEIIYAEKVCSGIITTLRITAAGRDLLVNSQDRIIRTFRIPNLSVDDLDLDTIQLPLEHKFQDVVNKLSWNHVTFSATGEYVAASTYNNHELYVWERNHGSLVCMLKDPKEEQGVIEWHPSRALLAACGLETGRIYIWSVISPQKWSALAPDFAEVEENVEYIEREDEFDIYAQEEIHRRRLDAEDEDVDVLTLDPTKFDDDIDSFRLPILFNLGESDSEDEFIAVSTGTMRRRSPGEGQSDMDGPVDTAATRKGGAAKGGRGRKK
ncbi:WD domain-containing protein [Metarhizium album ARSEF 1941]|uniref:WD domain-containing protein n=1 Tax=Metarhizium album (strain ARSEF 1941) TaxID=1081103 RepID=A0A0B2WL80_METAS|nr:WD domain-containing protein [Metarhizium album ARSEF 1941]KHN96806.1 WD domain-containing protein [Metarhizium album ARSEF 1941]